MIGKKLKELIVRREIRQIKLADYLGISPSRLSNYLSDKREPDLEMLAKMAKYLGVDLNYFTDIRFQGKKEASYSISEQAGALAEETAAYSALNHTGCVNIPYMSINSKKRAAKTKTAAVSKMFLNGITDPAENAMLFEVTTGVGGDHFKQGDYVVAARYASCQKTNGMLMFETGRNGKIYRYIEETNGGYLLSDTKELRRITDEELSGYYVVVWVMTQP
jgi:transcriptional regulator with XRE-family HTH domain